MIKNSLLAFVKIEQPFGVKPPIMHCPICGQAQLIEVDDVFEMDACKHLAYVFMGEVGEITYQSETFRND